MNYEKIRAVSDVTGILYFLYPKKQGRWWHREVGQILPYVSVYAEIHKDHSFIKVKSSTAFSWSFGNQPCNLRKTFSSTKWIFTDYTGYCVT